MGQHILTLVQAGEYRLSCCGEGVHGQEATYDAEAYRQGTKSLQGIQK